MRSSFIAILFLCTFSLVNSCQMSTNTSTTISKIKDCFLPPLEDNCNSKQLGRTSPFYSLSIRIFVDYTNVITGLPSEINAVKRVMNITASYWYSVINVTRLPKLYFPPNTTLLCNTINIPQSYVTNGTIGDIGIVAANEDNSNQTYVAKSSACALLASNKRPFWGAILFNNPFLKYDQEGFQETVFIALHEMTHVLGFSAYLYDNWVGGNPVINRTSPTSGIVDYYISTPKINAFVKDYYNCTTAPGMLLEDQDGTLISSHWEKKITGNQYMISSTIKEPYVSNITLAALQSTGWYAAVNYTFGEPSLWGKNKSCFFLNIDNCSSSQFCDGTQTFSCDFWGTGIAMCQNDVYTGTCLMFKYFTNTICTNEAYSTVNLNAGKLALESEGYTAKCFSTDYHNPNVTIDPAQTQLDYRCYTAVCSSSGSFIFVLVGNYILICYAPNQVIQAIPGLNGTFTCPSTFANYCKKKKICPYHCNMNGACINGKCLCFGAKVLTPICLAQTFNVSQIGSTGGFLLSTSAPPSSLSLSSIPTSSIVSQQNTLLGQSIAAFSGSNISVSNVYSISNFCITGRYLDSFGECMDCKEVFNCSACGIKGCITCDYSTLKPINGYC